MNAKSFTKLEKYNFKENVWCSFTTHNNENILIGNIYHSPHSEDSNTENLLNLLKCTDYNHFNKVYITGDFKYPNLNWNGKCDHSKNEMFKETINDGFLIQHVNKPTRSRGGQRSNIFDLVFSKKRLTSLILSTVAPWEKVTIIY